MPAHSLHPGSPPIMDTANRDLRRQGRFFRLTWTLDGSTNMKNPGTMTIPVRLWEYCEHEGRLIKVRSQLSQPGYLVCAEEGVTLGPGLALCLLNRLTFQALMWKWSRHCKYWVLWMQGTENCSAHIIVTEAAVPFWSKAISPPTQDESTVEVIATAQEAGT